MLESLFRYYHDCVEAQLDWSNDVNVLSKKGCDALGLSTDQQWDLAADGHLVLDSDDAMEMAKHVAAGGPKTRVELGALFLVGKVLDQDGELTREVCAPLLTTPLHMTLDLDRGVAVCNAIEQELVMNYGLVSELMRGQSDSLADQLHSLAAVVPDFPIEPEEFQRFWNALLVIAEDLPLESGLPRKRKRRKSSSSKSSAPSDGIARRPKPLAYCDYFVPTIENRLHLRLMPATAILRGELGGASQAMLADLAAAAADEEIANSAAAQLYSTAPVGGASRSSADNGLLAGGADDPSEPSSMGDRDQNFELPLPVALTDAQAQILRRVRTEPLTVVTGPPGTGKSYTIIAMVLDALQSGRTLLVASQMDKAVQVVADGVESLLGGTAIARSGGRSVQRSLAAKLDRITSANAPTAPSAQQLAETQQQVEELERQLWRTHDRLRETCDAERKWSSLELHRLRNEPICPLPIVDMPARLVATARRNATLAEQCLAPERSWLSKWWGRWKERAARNALQVPNDVETNWDDLRELIAIQEARAEQSQIAATMSDDFPANHLWAEATRLFAARNEAAMKLVRLRREQQLADLVSDDDRRQQLRQLASLLRRRRHDLKSELRRGLDPNVLLWAFPVWCSTCRSLGEILPMTPGLFDVVVLDEASQCDPASAAVAVARGRRAVVVGDPAQLSHVSFLSKAREQGAIAEHQLPDKVVQRNRYRRSLFELAADSVSQSNFFLLDEHFRSDPQIISFSNDTFYDGQLKLMTTRPGRQRSPAVQVNSVDGRRDEKSQVNQAEVDAIVERLQQWMNADEELPRSSGEGPLTLGVLSPFRGQADAILERLTTDIPAEQWTRHEVVVGTAHAFQGDERDVILLSTSLDSSSHPASLRFLQNPNLLNVSLTRARRRLEVVTSLVPSDLPAGLLRQFLEYALSDSQPWLDHASALPCSEFADAFHQRADEAGLKLAPQFRAAGQWLDFADEGLQAIWLDQESSSGDPVRQHHALHRAGWKCFRLPHRLWSADWHRCVEELGRQ